MKIIEHTIGNGFKSWNDVYNINPIFPNTFIANISLDHFKSFEI